MSAISESSTACADCGQPLVGRPGMLELLAARTDQRVARAAEQAVRLGLPASGGGAVDASAMARAARDIVQNPALYFYRLRNEGSHLASLLVPISLPFIGLVFVRRRDVCATVSLLLIAIVALD